MLYSLCLCIYYFVLLALAKQTGGHLEIFPEVVDNEASVENFSFGVHKFQGILLSFESDCRSLLRLVRFDELYAAVVPEESCQLLQLVQGFRNIFQENCVLALPLLRLRAHKSIG